MSRALVITENENDIVAAVKRALDGGAEAVIVVSNGSRIDKSVLAALHAIGRVRFRFTVATFDEAVHTRLGAEGHPREIVRAIALAAQSGHTVDVVLPIAEGAGPVAGRLHGLSRAAPRIARYLVAPVPDDLPWRSPDAIASEIAEARAVAQELSLPLSLDDDTRTDTELQAVLCGRKPVLRVSTEGTTEAVLRARYESLGLVGCAADGLFIDERGEHGRKLRLLYFAERLDVAETVRDIEQRTFDIAVPMESRGDRYHAMGIALGYPRCCVDAYVERVIRQPHGKLGLAEAYVVARAARVDHASWRLDHLLFETGDALVTFSPCSYRCSAALEYADDVFARVASESPLAAQRLERRLAVDLVVDRFGGRAIVGIENGRIISARERRTPEGAHVHPSDASLVARLARARVRDGHIDSGEPHPPVVVQFER